MGVFQEVDFRFHCQTNTAAVMKPKLQINQAQIMGDLVFSLNFALRGILPSVCGAILSVLDFELSSRLHYSQSRYEERRQVRDPPQKEFLSHTSFHPCRQDHVLNFVFCHLQRRRA